MSLPFWEVDFVAGSAGKHFILKVFHQDRGFPERAEVFHCPVFSVILALRSSCILGGGNIRRDGHSLCGERPFHRVAGAPVVGGLLGGWSANLHPATGIEAAFSARFWSPVFSAGEAGAFAATKQAQPGSLGASDGPVFDEDAKATLSAEDQPLAIGRASFIEGGEALARLLDRALQSGPLIVNARRLARYSGPKALRQGEHFLQPLRASCPRDKG